VASADPPAGTTTSGLPVACACAGSWQVAHDICPDADRLASLKIFSPSAAAGLSAEGACASLSPPPPPQAESASARQVAASQCHDDWNQARRGLQSHSTAANQVAHGDRAPKLAHAATVIGARA